MDEIKKSVKAYILQEFLPDESPDKLTDSTPLVTQGILDSLALLKLVSFLEEEFDVQLAAHEVGVDHMNTISEIAQLVQSKHFIRQGIRA